MAANLVKAGQPFNASTSRRREDLRPRPGASRLRESPAKPSPGADTVMTMLPAADQVLASHAGVVPHAEGRPGLDCSTIDVESARAVAAAPPPC